MKKLITAFLLFFILFFVSCGMPNSHDYSSDVVVTRVGRDQNYLSGFRVHFYNNQIDINPSVLLMYTIADDDYSLISNFNSYIRNSSNYYNGIPATFLDNGRLENVESTAGNKTIYFYEFTGKDINNNRVNVSSSPDYTFSQLNTAHDYYFMIKKGTSDDNSGFHFILDIFQDSIDNQDPLYSINLFRYDENSFLSDLKLNEISSENDYSFYIDSIYNEGDSYNIQLFLALCIVPSSDSSYSNIFWTQPVNIEINCIT